MTKILRVEVHETSYFVSTKIISNWAISRGSRYICIANVHMLMEAWDDPKFAAVLKNADLITPDGMPLVWMMLAKGARAQQRVYGPTLMFHVLEAAARENLAVGFYGGKPEVLNVLTKRMQARYPGLKVAVSCSPLFGDQSPEQDAEVVEKINNSGVRILFVGLGCPKQEKWMGEHRGRVRAVMIGVGAAFDFHAGMKSQAPAWLQRIGLEWLFRLINEPRRLWRRYLYHNPRFVILAIADLLGLIR